MAGPRPKQRAYLKNAAELLQHVRNALRVIVLSPSLGKLASSSWRPYRPDNERRRSISNGLSKEVACAPVIAMTFALLPCPDAVVAMRLERRRAAESVQTIWITLPEAADTSLEAPAQKTTTMNAGSELPAR
jgi:hypothetical protein